MGRAPCCDKANVKKGPWSPEEDAKLKEHIEKYGSGGNWIALPQKAGLKRCGKSCRLRWLNYLRPNIKHGGFTEEEDTVICSLFASIGSRWSIIAAQLPGRTDNDIKNHWNTKLKKNLMTMAPPYQSQRESPPFPSSHQTPPILPTHSPSLLLKDLIDGTNDPCYYPSAKSFTAFDPISPISSNILGNNSSTTLAANSSSWLLSQECLVSPSVQCYQSGKESNFLSFGSEASCSSNSDGSCSQISYGCRDIKQDDMGFQSYIPSGHHEENQKFMISYGNNGGETLNQWAAEKANGYFGETPLEYGLEDVKQLISSNSGSVINDCNNNNFILDEKKTQEKIMNMFAYY